MLPDNGYAGDNGLGDAARPGSAVTLAFCWSHFRSQFYNINKGRKAPIATAALENSQCPTGNSAGTKEPRHDLCRADGSVYLTSASPSPGTSSLFRGKKQGKCVFFGVNQP